MSKNKKTPGAVTPDVQDTAFKFRGVRGFRYREHGAERVSLVFPERINGLDLGLEEMQELSELIRQITFDTTRDPLDSAGEFHDIPVSALDLVCELLNRPEIRGEGV